MSANPEDLAAQIDAFSDDESDEVDTTVTPAEEEEDTRPFLERLGEEEPLFEGGPTRKWVEAIKAQLPKGLRIICTPLADNTGIIWKTANRGEWKAIQSVIQSQQDERKREDFIFSKICLWPQNLTPESLNELPAGAIPAIMSEFYLYSGFQPIMESIEL